MERKEILEEAARIVTGERQNQYGDAEDSFGLIAGLWGDYLNHPVSSKDVALMMILLKVAREKGGKGKADNWVDIAGYAACGGEIATGKTDLSDMDVAKIAAENEHKRALLRAIFGDTDKAEAETDSIVDIVRELREISDNLYRVAHDLEDEMEDEE